MAEDGLSVPQRNAWRGDGPAWPGSSWPAMELHTYCIAADETGRWRDPAHRGQDLSLTELPSVRTVLQIMQQSAPPGAWGGVTRLTMIRGLSWVVYLGSRWHRCRPPGAWRDGRPAWPGSPWSGTWVSCLPVADDVTVGLPWRLRRQ